MTDVLIYGSGPAGLAAAITLRRQGRAVTVVQREANLQQTRVGESLSATALVSLKELDLLNDFLRANHPPCNGNSSCWGNNNLAFFDFIQSPMGTGWYIDRVKFDHMLRSRAIKVGVNFITAGRTARLERNADESWRYHTANNETPHIDASILIDASGRQSWLGRHLGTKRTSDDKQIAATAIFRSDQRIKSFHSMVEAVKDGWWYVADYGTDTSVCIFFTDPGIHKLLDLTDPSYFNLQKENTLFVRHRLPEATYKLTGTPELSSAGSNSLAEFTGPGWLAAGDAACAMDPLSSHGISFALRSGIDAALAADSTLKGSSAAICQYDENLTLAIKIYREQRLKIYQQETRWTEYDYWQKRQSMAIV